jgi:hypothetical protein
MCSRTSLRFRHDSLVAEADERDGADGNRPRSGRAAALLGLCQVRRLRDGEARSPLEAARAGVGLSRSRHRAPSTWMIECSPVPPDERRVAGGRLTRVSNQHTSDGEVASCWRPHRRRAAT